MRLESFPRWRSLGSFVAIASALTVPVGLSLWGIEPADGVPPALASPPLGYTRSLVLFLFPMALLGIWFLRHPLAGFKRRAFWWSIALLTPLGFGLDALFATVFFRFPNHAAVLGDCVTASGGPRGWDHASLLCIPARGGVVPVEEFVFYLSGFVVVLLCYVWADEYWLAAYNVEKYAEKAAPIPRLVRFHAGSLVLGVTLLAAIFAWHSLVSRHEGWPAYATFLILVAVVPTAGLFRSARDFINWRAFAFTFFLILLVSLIWEATLALPSGWWGYNPRYMIGEQIGAWNDLPIEAVFVWFAVTWTTVVVFETVKIWRAMDRPVRKAFFG